MEDFSDRGADVRLYMITIINANHEELLNILEYEEICGRSYTLSTANLIFESFLTVEELADVFRDYDVIQGLNFLIIDITDVCSPETMHLQLNVYTNSKIKEMMEFILGFYDSKELMEKIKRSNEPNLNNINKILEKINKKGMKSLSRKEQKLLRTFSEKE